MNFRTFLFSFLIVFVIVFATSSCQKDTYVSDADRYAAENELYLKFLEANFDAYYDRSVIIDTTFVIDSISHVVTDTVINRRVYGNKDSVDLVYWEKETGIGDTITPGQTVGYRFKLHTIYNDDYGLVKDSVYHNNYEDAEPATATIDALNSSGTLATYFGLNEGLQHMRLNGKAWMLMPSSQASKDFYSRFYEIEVVYVSR